MRRSIKNCAKVFILISVICSLGFNSKVMASEITKNISTQNEAKYIDESTVTLFLYTDGEIINSDSDCIQSYKNILTEDVEIEAFTWQNQLDESL